MHPRRPLPVWTSTGGHACANGTAKSGSRGRRTGAVCLDGAKVTQTLNSLAKSKVKDCSFVLFCIVLQLDNLCTLPTVPTFPSQESFIINIAIFYFSFYPVCPPTQVRYGHLLLGCALDTFGRRPFCAPGWQAPSKRPLGSLFCIIY